MSHNVCALVAPEHPQNMKHSSVIGNSVFGNSTLLCMGHSVPIPRLFDQPFAEFAQTWYVGIIEGFMIQGVVQCCIASGLWLTKDSIFHNFVPITLTLFPSQFFINRTDEKTRPGIDFIGFCTIRQTFIEFQ